MRKLLLSIASAFLLPLALQIHADTIIRLQATNNGDDTKHIQEAINKAAQYKGKPVTIQLEQGNYNISRLHSTERLYHISNTTSVEENPNPVKHIGLYLKHLKNVTIDGGGAHLVTHGEMTSFAIDSCENITLRNFTLKAYDPSLPEVTVEEVGSDYVKVRTSSDTRYTIRNGKLYWIGEGWEFTDGIAQVFWPERNVTNRKTSPMEGLTKAEEVEPGVLILHYPHTPQMKVGEVYQMRHSFRTEVCGFINRSCNVTLKNINFNFLGNFGIVGQFSENLTYDHIVCAPALGSDRTGAGFADFVQMSGCRGLISITNSRFEGAHDDPINIHGTHLKIVEYLGERQIKVRFMHNQTFGFDAFSRGDEVELVDGNSLLNMQSAKVKDVSRLDNYNYVLTLDKPVAADVRAAENVSVENVTWTPEVYIARNYFARTPTRGVLVTTRRKVVIEDNTFFRIPMSAILFSDDARGWYESGPVHNAVVRHNEFIECGSPVVNIWPEIATYKGAVHRNISIENNRFVIPQGGAVSARATDNLTVRGNCFETNANADELIKTENCNQTQTTGNHTL